MSSHLPAAAAAGNEIPPNSPRHHPPIPPTSGVTTTPRLSLDIFFQSDSKGAAHLFPSTHMGHLWFRQVAESFRGDFVEALAQEDRSVECGEMATALAYKLLERGVIYERNIFHHSDPQQRQQPPTPWRPVRDPFQVRDLVFRGLLTLFATTTAHNNNNNNKNHGDDKNENIDPSQAQNRLRPGETATTTKKGGIMAPPTVTQQQQGAFPMKNHRQEQPLLSEAGLASSAERERLKVAEAMTQLDDPSTLANSSISAHNSNSNNNKTKSEELPALPSTQHASPVLMGGAPLPHPFALPTTMMPAALALHPLSPSAILASPSCAAAATFPSSTTTTPNSSGIITQLGMNDMLCGRRQEDGVLVDNLVGNLLFGSIAISIAPAFAMAPTHLKAKYAMEAVELMHSRIPRGRFVVERCGGRGGKDKEETNKAAVATGGVYYEELSLEESRWRAYWTFEKRATQPIRMGGAAAAAGFPGRGVGPVHEMVQQVVGRVNTNIFDNEAYKQLGKHRPNKDDRPLTEQEKKEMFQYVPTHLTLVAKLENEARNSHKVSIIEGMEGLEFLDGSKSSAAQSESGEEDSTTTKANTVNQLELVKRERAKRRREKFERAKAILLGKAPPFAAPNGNPFTDIEERRAMAIKELKERSKRTAIRKRLATWDPSSVEEDY